MTLGRSFTPSGSRSFLHVKGERFGLFLPCPVILNHWTLMFWFKFKNSRIPTLILFTPCSVTQSSMFANLCLASISHSWAIFTFWMAPHDCSYRDLWLPYSIHIQQIMRFLVIPGNTWSEKQSWHIPWGWVPCQCLHGLAVQTLLIFASSETLDPTKPGREGAELFIKRNSSNLTVKPMPKAIILNSFLLPKFIWKTQSEERLVSLKYQRTKHQKMIDILGDRLLNV